MSPTEIETRRMVKRKGLKQFKRLKTPWISKGTKKRRMEREDVFGKRSRSIEKCVWEMKNILLFNPQNSRVYVNGSKIDVHNNIFFHRTNNQSSKVMVSACATSNGVTKPFFGNEKEWKVNPRTYKKHFEKELLNIENIIKRNDWVFIQDSHIAQI